MTSFIMKSLRIVLLSATILVSTSSAKEYTLKLSEEGPIVSDLIRLKETFPSLVELRDEYNTHPVYFYASPVACDTHHPKGCPGNNLMNHSEGRLDARPCRQENGDLNMFTTADIRDITNDIKSFIRYSKLDVVAPITGVHQYKRVYCEECSKNIKYDIQFFAEDCTMCSDRVKEYANFKVPGVKDIVYDALKNKLLLRLIWTASVTAAGGVERQNDAITGFIGDINHSNMSARSKTSKHINAKAQDNAARLLQQTYHSGARRPVRSARRANGRSSRKQTAPETDSDVIRQALRAARRRKEAARAPPSYETVQANREKYMLKANRARRSRKPTKPRRNRRPVRFEVPSPRANIPKLRNQKSYPSASARRRLKGGKGKKRKGKRSKGEVRYNRTSVNPPANPVLSRRRKGKRAKYSRAHPVNPPSCSLYSRHPHCAGCARCAGTQKVYTFTKRPLGLTIYDADNKVMLSNVENQGCLRQGIVEGSQLLSVNNLRWEDPSHVFTRASVIQEIQTAQLPIKISFKCPA